jgi:chemotaxis protein histidine kinase CheA
VVGVKKGDEKDVANVREHFQGERERRVLELEKKALEKDIVPSAKQAPLVNKKELEKAQKEREKAEAKAQKEREKADADAKKELEKAQKENEKAEAKAQKERAKEEERAAKEREKALEKERKELEKAQAKAEEKEIKALEKALAKAEKKSKKGGAGSDDESDTEELDAEEAEEKEIDEEKEEDGDEGVKENDEDFIEIEGIKDIDAKQRDFDELEGDEILDSYGDVEYKTAIAQAYAVIKKYKSDFLSPEKLEIYSPKFLRMLQNIEDPEHRGLHLVYSQFRSMEGIGIFALVLEANGFAHFKIKKTGIDSWELNMSEEDMGKPTYALYTGTEEADEREIIRNIYNGMWDNIPNNIAEQLRRRSANNNLGEIIKVLMITSAGSEGINLRNTRYVHIMEPYWHPVRSEQVIGRARRICSHKDLPIELQTVEVFIYIMVFTQKQLDSDNAIELRINPTDRGKVSPYPIQTSDEKLFEISNIKERLSSQLLTGIKEASIDCATYTKSNTKEGLVCLSFGKPSVNDFSYNPDLFKDENDTVAAANRITIDWEARPFTDKYGKQYMMRVDTQQIYDYDSVIQALKIPGVRPVLLGKLVKNREGNFEIIRDKP